MKWEYTLSHRSEIILDVFENDRRLLQVFLPEVYGNFLVYDGPFAGCAVGFDPFRLLFPAQSGWFMLEKATPVFIYQEQRL
jgi:hypothetical protein